MRAEKIGSELKESQLGLFPVNSSEWNFVFAASPSSSRSESLGIVESSR